MEERLLAVLALAAWAAALVVTALMLAGNVGWLLLALVGIALASAGVWWALTERGVRRVLGSVVALTGVVGTGLALLGAASDARIPFARLGLLVVLVALSGAAARRALRREIRAIEAGRPHPVPAPRHPALICNPRSGGGKVGEFGLVELARDMGVRTLVLEPGRDLERLARDAVAEGADCLGMAGGDGSQALVASVAIDAGLPFVCIPAGTRNHFALDLGIGRADPRQAMRAFSDAVERRVDHATVNGRLFVNNVSMGVYAATVQQEGYREAKAQTAGALLPELLGRAGEPFDLRFTTPGGREVDGAFMVLVSNNPYVMGVARDTAQRRRLDTGRLGVVAITGRSGAEAARLVSLAATGQQRRSPDWIEFTTDALTVRSRSGTAALGVDGESMSLSTPLEFRIHPGALRLLVTRDNPAAAARRRGRDVRPSDLVDLARGRSPAIGAVTGPPAPT